MTNVCPKCRDILPEDARACACGWRLGEVKGKVPDTACACGNPGQIKRDGAWFCKQCSGFAPGLTKGYVSYRERWYEEHDIPYEPANLDNAGFLRCVGGSLPKQGPIRAREPGDDDEAVAA